MHKAAIIFLIVVLVAFPAHSQELAHDFSAASDVVAQAPARLVAQSKWSRQNLEKYCLREIADQKGFLISTMIFNQRSNTLEYRTLLSREFNCAVVMTGMDFIQPEPGEFHLTGLDQAVRYARMNKMSLIGAPLVYRNSNSPDWLHFKVAGCGAWTPEALDKLLRNHIHTVVGHCGNGVAIWEVVNETFAPGGNGCWSRVLGQEQLIAKAFQYAREANPHALLMLNETFGHEGVDRQRCNLFFALVRRLKATGTPVDVVGCQLHLEAQALKPDYLDEFKYFLESARSTHVRVMVTELDVYQGPAGTFSDPWQNQARIFHDIAAACLAAPHCIGLQTWGLSDRFNWLKTRPRNAYPDAQPLMFDYNFNKKPAYYGVLQALLESNRTPSIR